MYTVSKIETKQGSYYLHFDGEFYGITRFIEKRIHCAYSSLHALFKSKGI